MSYIANILQVETWPKFSKCPQGAPEWKKNSKFSKIFYFYPKLLKIAFGIIVSSSDNYGREWVKTCFRFEEERLRMKFNANSNPIFKQATTTIQNPMFCKESWNPELDHEHWSIKHKSPHKYILKKLIQKRAKFPWDQREVRISSSHQLLVSCK